jgi:aryl-alcohol dehydrogenase-like predicted oxidoreductase
MDIRNLGRSGLRVSTIGLGCNNFGARVDHVTAQAVVHKALDVGITLFDTADTYGNRGGSETALGQILGPRRKDIVLASKFGMAMDDVGVKRGASRRYIMAEVEASLERLKTDWIDLYQLHQPDPLTPIEETLDALDTLVRSGKVRYIGCSNLHAWQVAEAVMTSRSSGLAAFISAQDELSLVVRKAEGELLPALDHFGLGLLPYFPLASGLLTGKYQRNKTLPEGSRLARPDVRRWADRYLTEHNFEIVEKLGDFAQARGHSLLELAFSWLLCKRPVASVIAGATSAQQIEQNVKAGSWSLSAEDLAEIDRICGM